MDKTSGKVQAVVDGVMKASTYARQAEVKAWEQEFTPCEHTLCLEQETARQIESQGLYNLSYWLENRLIDFQILDIVRCVISKKISGSACNAATWAVGEPSLEA